MNKVILGDALSVLKELPSESVHCAVTSPPYFRPPKLSGRLSNRFGGDARRIRVEAGGGLPRGPAGTEGRRGLVAESGGFVCKQLAV